MRRIGQQAWRAAALAAASLRCLLLLAGPAVGRCTHLPAARSRARIGGHGGGGSAQVQEIRPRGRRPAQTSCRRRAAAPAGRAAASPSWRSAQQCAARSMPRSTRWSAISRRLQRKRSALAGGGGSGATAQRILAALDANNCRDKIVAERRAGARAQRQRFFDRLFGRRERGSSHGRAPDAGIGRVLEPNRTTTAGATARRAARQRQRHPHPQPEWRRDLDRRPAPATSPPCACAPATVISSRCRRRSSAADFDRDLKNCESACPGAEMQLLLSASRRRGIGDDGLGRHRRALCVAADRLSLSRCGNVAAAGLRLQSGRPSRGSRSSPASRRRTVAGRAGDPDAGRPPGPGATIRKRWPIAEAGSTCDTDPAHPQAEAGRRADPDRRGDARSGSSGQCSFPTQQRQ